MGIGTGKGWWSLRDFQSFWQKAMNLGLVGPILYKKRMPTPRCSADQPLAILTFHSHSDRSFLDDRELATLSGALRHEQIANDLVLVAITGGSQADAADAERNLAELLSGYDPIVYERVWDPEVVARLRDQLPDKTFIGLRGEHELLDDAPADIFCNGEPKQVLAPLVAWLRGERDLPPRGALFRGEQGWRESDPSAPVEVRSFPYAPNLRPVILNRDRLPESRTFSVTGNEGCPYQQDARENPLYAGTEIPQRFGRGCAFCTTGNHYAGRPNEETAASVFEQIRYVREQAPELRLLVLKDQNPFGYLTEVVERCAAESVSGFTLLLETRAEWFLRNAGRFARALQVAGESGIRLAPFLVGIENFSQAELDRFNKGIQAETNFEFLETLWQWKDRYGDALDLGHAAFGFILFSPWTTMRDLEINFAGIQRTRLDRLRGSILLSRARLYEDTALFYLAQRDGLLVDEFESQADDASRRYGYYPSRPWRHVHSDVAHFAALATELAERNHSRDMLRLFELLLSAFREAGANWRELTAHGLWQRYQSEGTRKENRGDRQLAPASEEFLEKFAALIAPLPIQGDFAGGWQIGGVATRPGRVEVEMCHAEEPAVRLELVPRGDGPYLRRSRHYHLRAIGKDLNPSQQRAAETLVDAIVANDR